MISVLIIILITAIALFMKHKQLYKFAALKTSERNENIKIAIVGGGVAGLFTAYLLARRNFVVTVFERATLPQDKACGEGLSTHGQEILKFFGFLDEKDFHSTKKIAGIKFKNNHGTVKACYCKSQQTLAIRRTLLSEKMLYKLQNFSNVKILERTPFIYARQTDFDYVIGADGLRSITAKHAHFKATNKLGISRTGFRQHFYATKQSDFLQVFFTQYGDLYLTPIGQNISQLALLTNTHKTPFETWEVFLKEVPELNEYVDLAKPLSKLKAHGPMSWLVFKPLKKNLALIGDAFCTFDACTGVGITKALKHALLFSAHFPWVAHSRSARIYCTFKIYHSLLFYLGCSYLLLAISKFSALQTFALKLQRFTPITFNVLTSIMLRCIDYPSASKNLRLHGEIFKPYDALRADSLIFPNNTTKVS